jgi:hypothetical protein
VVDRDRVGRASTYPATLAPVTATEPRPTQQGIDDQVLPWSRGSSILANFDACAIDRPAPLHPSVRMPGQCG